MVKHINDLIKENDHLISENISLSAKLKAATEIIEAIKKGNIDAVFIANNGSSNVLVSQSADQGYRRFIENMSEGVLTLQTDGIIVYSNTSFAMMIGLPLEKVIGTNVRQFVPIEFIDPFEQLLSENPQTDSKLELSILNSTGRRSHFIVSLNSLHLLDFEALNLVWTDVTDQKEAEEKLITVNEDLNRAIEAITLSENKVVMLNDKLQANNKTLLDTNIELATFAHIASHDLQEPLRKIITYCSLLNTDYYHLIDEPGKNYITKIERASARMRNLITDILDYSKLSQTDHFFGPANIQSIVNSILSDLEVVIKESDAKITIEKELPVIEANPSQMRQLFQNIIGNSLKFKKTDGIPEISITYKMLQGKDIEKTPESMLTTPFCIFYIQDNGIGFDPHYISKMFTIFQRLNSTAAYAGTGIGLAICKKIVEKHNGFITAKSNHKDGALFEITLPVKQPVH